MSVAVHTLSNGATVLIDHMPQSQTTALSYTFRIGSRYEAENENGLAHFFEHMAFKGTKNRDAHSLNASMDALGATSNAFTSYEVTSYYMHGLNEDALQFNEIQADMAMHLTLPAEELEKERGVILQEIKMYADMPDSNLSNGLMATLYAGQALGRTILGPPENIRNFDRGVFDAFRQKHYHAGNLIVSVAGGADPQAILQDIEQRLVDVPQGTRSQYEPAKYTGGNLEIVRPEMQQKKLMVAFESSAAGNQDNLAETVMNIVLSGGMSSRLFTEIREKRGLVYSVSSGFSRLHDTGVFMARAGTGPEKVAELLPVLCDELNKIRQEPVTDAEFARAKKKIRVHTGMENDAMSDDRMKSNMMEYNIKGRIGTQEEFDERVAALTKDDLMEAARRVFSGKPTFASIGPAKKTVQEEIAARMGLEL